MVASTLIAIGVAEAVARLTGIGHEYARLLPLHDVAVRTVDGVVLWSTNLPRASRADIARAAQDSDAFTIVGLGDSIMYGVGQPKDATYLEQTRHILSSRSPRPVEVINLAVPGYNTLQECATYREVEDELKADLVVVHYWGDDVHQYRVAGGYVVDVGDISEDGRLVVRALPLPPELSDFLLLHSRLYDILTHVAVTARNREPTDRSRITKPLSELHDRLEQRGGHLVVLASPEFSGATPKPISDLAELQQFASASGVELIDLSQWLNGVDTKDVALDSCCHFNAEGHRVIAEHLAAYVLARGLRADAGAAGDGN